MRGIVRAEGWVEAEEADAQRNPVAKREHRIILGHAPSAQVTRNDRLLGVPMDGGT